MAPRLCAPPPRLPGPPGLGFFAELGLGGFVVQGRWAPLWLARDGDMDGARIEITGFDSAGREGPTQSFPTVIHGPIECPVLIDSASAGLRVRLCVRERGPRRTRLQAPRPGRGGRHRGP